MALDVLSEFTVKRSDESKITCEGEGEGVRDMGRGKEVSLETGSECQVAASI